MRTVAFPCDGNIVAITPIMSDCGYWWLMLSRSEREEARMLQRWIFHCSNMQNTRFKYLKFQKYKKEILLNIVGTNVTSYTHIKTVVSWEIMRVGKELKMSESTYSSWALLPEDTFRVRWRFHTHMKTYFVVAYNLPFFSLYIPHPEEVTKYRREVSSRGRVRSWHKTLHYYSSSS